VVDPEVEVHLLLGLRLVDVKHQCLDVLHAHLCGPMTLSAVDDAVDGHRDNDQFVVGLIVEGLPVQHEVLLVPLGSTLHRPRCNQSSLRESQILRKDLVRLRSIYSIHHGVEEFGCLFHSTKRGCACDTTSAYLRNGVLEVLPSNFDRDIFNALLFFELEGIDNAGLEGLVTLKDSGTECLDDLDVNFICTQADYRHQQTSDFVVFDSKQFRNILIALICVYDKLHHLV